MLIAISMTQVDVAPQSLIFQAFLHWLKLFSWSLIFQIFSHFLKWIIATWNLIFQIFFHWMKYLVQLGIYRLLSLCCIKVIGKCAQNCIFCLRNTSSVKQVQKESEDTFLLLLAEMKKCLFVCYFEGSSFQVKCQQLAKVAEQYLDHLIEEPLGPHYIESLRNFKNTTGQYLFSSNTRSIYITILFI